MKHLRRCPATHLPKVGDHSPWPRCELPAGHEEAHYDGEIKFVFTEGSYSGLASDHPDYNELVKA